MKYKQNPLLRTINIKTLDGEDMVVEISHIERAVDLTNETLQALSDFN
jgi:hypothetical protein